MEITDIRLRLVEGEGKVRGVVSITLENCFVIHDIKLVEGFNGLFVAMPSRKGPDGVYRDIAHPIELETRQKISEMIIRIYNEKLAGQETAEG